MEKKKQCSKCKEIKLLTDFYNHNNTFDSKTHHCKECMTTYRKENAEKNRIYMQNLRDTDNDKVKNTRNKSYQNTPINIKLLNQAKNRANRKNIEFNLIPEDITIPKVCPYLKIEFIIGTKNNYEQTHSLDRKDNNKGYIKGNVEVVSKKANSMKNSASKEELINFAIEIIKRNKDNDIVQTMLKDIESKNKES